MIKNEYRLTWEVYRTWLSESRWKPPMLAFTIMWTVLGAISIGITLLSRYVPFLFFAVFAFYRAFFRCFLVGRGQYNVAAKDYGQKDWIRTIAFDAEQIVQTEGNTSANYRYADIIDIREKGNRAWLIMRNKKAIRLYKDCFGDSSWEECRALIEEKRRTPDQQD